jgi:hypothetical protein
VQSCDSNILLFVLDRKRSVEDFCCIEDSGGYLITMYINLLGIVRFEYDLLTANFSGRVDRLYPMFDRRLDTMVVASR